MLNAKRVSGIQNVFKSISGALPHVPQQGCRLYLLGDLQDPPDPGFYSLRFALTLWETQSSIQKTARAVSA